MTTRAPRRLAAAATALLLAGPAVAQSGAVEGPGGQPCRALTTAQSDSPETFGAYGVFISGFLMAANAYEEDTFDLTPWQTPDVMLAQVARFCAANPDQPIGGAIAAYLQYLRPDRLQEPSEVVEATNGQETVRLYAAVVDRIRERLEADGRLEAGGTGFDGAVSEALLAFQRERGLAETGVPDPATLIALLGS